MKKKNGLTLAIIGLLAMAFVVFPVAGETAESTPLDLQGAVTSVSSISWTKGAGATTYWFKAPHPDIGWTLAGYTNSAGWNDVCWGIGDTGGTASGWYCADGTMGCADTPTTLGHGYCTGYADNMNIADLDYSTNAYEFDLEFENLEYETTPGDIGSKMQHYSDGGTVKTAVQSPDLQMAWDIDDSNWLPFESKSRLALPGNGGQAYHEDIRFQIIFPKTSFVAGTYKASIKAIMTF